MCFLLASSASTIKKCLQKRRIIVPFRRQPQGMAFVKRFVEQSLPKKGLMAAGSLPHPLPLRIRDAPYSGQGRNFPPAKGCGMPPASASTGRGSGTGQGRARFAAMRGVSRGWAVFAGRAALRGAREGGSASATGGARQLALPGESLYPDTSSGVLSPERG